VKILPLTLDFTFFYNVINRVVGWGWGTDKEIVRDRGGMGYIDTWNLTDISGVACSKAAYS